MRNLKRAFWGTFVFLVLLWITVEPTVLRSSTFFGLREAMLQLTGFVAIGCMSLAMVLALRPRWPEAWLGGLDKMYRMHKWLGISALVVATAHWLWAQGPKWAVGWGWLERPVRGVRIAPESPVAALLSSQRGVAEGVGEWAFYAVVVLIVLALMAASASVMAQTAAPAPAGESAASGTLRQVNVRGEYNREDLPVAAPGGKAATGARLGILGATRIMDAPVHVNAYTRELFEDYNALTLSDVLENDPAVRFTTNKSHLLQNFNLRGQDMTAMDIATNGLYGIAPANQVPIELFERVEVLRGPNVLLSGMPPASSVAGTVNMVTKRALVKPLAELTMTYGSHSYGQLHADLGKRFGEEQRLGIRFNGVYGKGEVWLEGPGDRKGDGAARGVPEGTYWLQGHDGQTVGVVPSRHLVVVRLGLTPAWLDYRPQRLLAALAKALP